VGGFLRAPKCEGCMNRALPPVVVGSLLHYTPNKNKDGLESSVGAALTAARSVSDRAHRRSF